MPTINEIITKPPAYFDDPTWEDVPVDSIFSHHKRQQMFESRMKDLSKKEIARFADTGIIPEKELTGTDIVSLCENYGENLCYNENKQFSITANGENDIGYISKIIPVCKRDDETICIISFRLDWDEYIIYHTCRINDKTFEVGPLKIFPIRPE